MLKPLSLLFCLLALPAYAADWKYEGGTTPIAYADNGKAQFQFACRGGDLAMAYWVREPSPQVAAAQSLSLAINAVGGSVSTGKDTGFAQDFPMLHHDGSSVLIRGPVARQWARTAQQALETMELAFVKSKPGSGLDFLDRQRFGARGSSSAIGQVLATCGSTR
ncbi:hypothetical protein [Devosia sp.]|uniref:hypothetical protein n=1 Tax=Devosia sp. TaxID=1871048 RepID=UPI001AD05CEF|nr:hypothetical protein [Devosia sp.]MBN9335824.1 hypothetical protein [Devosia sp.]